MGKKYQNLKSFKCQLVNQILTLFGPDLLCKLILMICIGGSQLNKTLYKHVCTYINIKHYKQRLLLAMKQQQDVISLTADRFLPFGITFVFSSEKSSVSGDLTFKSPFYLFTT